MANATKQKAHYLEHWHASAEVMATKGLLLASADKQGRANAMTIGWGTVGWIWRGPVFVVLVRPSRYSYDLIEESGEFTVNVPPPELAEALSFCGSFSGRGRDKLAERKLTAVPGRSVTAPIIAECLVHYECKVVHRNDVIESLLDPTIKAGAYPSGDLHRVYYGEILDVYADPDAEERLKGWGKAGAT